MLQAKQENLGRHAPAEASQIILNHNVHWMYQTCKQSLLDQQDIKELGWYASLQGYHIPYLDPVTGEPQLCPDGREFVRTRLRHPRNDAKYLSPSNGGIRCFIPPDAHTALMQTPTLPLYLTEGEKKAACATVCGLPTIGLGGIWNWKESGTNDALNGDLLPYVEGGRDVVLIYDSDATETPRKTRDFADSARRLAVALEAYGAPLYRFDLPPGEDGAKIGLDDWLVQNAGDTVLLRALIDGEVR